MASKDTLFSLKSFFGGLSLSKKISFILLIGCTAAGFLFLILWTGRPDLAPLYSNLPPEDAGAIIEQLKAEKTPYQVTGGNTILVPKDQVFEITMRLAAQGLPQGGGVGFEIFDRTKLGMTEFEQDVNYQRALQGELARTIARFSAVKNCRVHIVMPAKSLFIEAEKPARASVTLEMTPGGRLDKTQIRGIVHLLSHSVPDLNENNISILDNKGNLMTPFARSDDDHPMEADYLALQQRIQQALELRVMSMLEPVLGPEKAIVRVSCALDLKRQETTEERYDPEKVPRSEKSSHVVSVGQVITPAGIPGVVSNASDIADAGGVAEGGNTTLDRREKTTNYEISKLTRRVVNPLGEVKRISVAVVVDGTYETTPPANEGDAPSTKYVPRSPEELDTIKKIVQHAVNYDQERGDRVEVANIPFEAGHTGTRQPPESGWSKILKLALPLLKYLFSGVLLFFIFIWIVRPIVKWLTQTPAIDGDLLKQLPMTVGEMEQAYGDARALPISSQLSRAAMRDKDQTVAVIREWLKEK